MIFDAREFTGLLVILAGCAVLGASYAAAWMFGRQKGQREMLRGENDLAARLARIEVAVDAIAIEVERQGEGQRALLMSSHAAEPPSTRLSQRPLPHHRTPA
jgi:hypothetical protein